MQTFLPYPDIRLSVQCLDNKRLGKQRIEALQIIRIIQGQTISKAWAHHPVVLMWLGYSELLCHYLNECIREWIFRGFQNTCPLQPVQHAIRYTVHPTWWGGPIHRTHRAALLRKEIEHYSQFNWKEVPDIHYYWPVRWDRNSGKAIASLESKEIKDPVSVRAYEQILCAERRAMLSV